MRQSFHIIDFVLFFVFVFNNMAPSHHLQQDPLSHRIIEKRRRDRMNSCLADLSRLIPPQFQRKGRGRIEKTEIIEMSIRYMKQLQNQECLHKENVYKMGYDECLQQAANFLYNTHREICYQLVEHLKEHSNDFLKGLVIIFCFFLFFVPCVWSNLFYFIVVVVFIAGLR